MFKVGDRVTLEGSDEHVYKVESKEKDSNIYTVVSVYTGRKDRYRETSLKKTLKNPVVVVETYGDEWRSNVDKALGGSKVRYKSFPVERNRDIQRFFVDAKKLTAAKLVIDDFYKKGLDKQNENETTDPSNDIVVDDDV